MSKPFKPSVKLTDNHVTDESVYLNRRQLLKSLGFVGASTLLSNPANAAGWFWEDEEKKAATDLQRLWAWRKPNCRLLPHVCQCRGFMFICYEQGWIYDGSFISFILLY